MSEPSTPPPADQPSQEEMARMLAERLAHTPVRDVLFQSLITFLDMAAVRLGLGPDGPEVADPTQARQAIEAARALVGVGEREMGPAQVRPFREPLAQIQMAYARMVEGAEPSASDQPEAQPAPGQGQPRAAAADPASRLWVPPGAR